jgi:hypothetical protein
MTSFIKVETFTVGAFLSGPRRLTLPWFQRSYAWSEPQIARLMADIRLAMSADVGRDRYSLGHIRLARAPGDSDDQLIDGSQRMTTLTILFSLLRDLAEGADAAELHRLVATGGMDGERSRMRLAPQPSVATFFERYVQAPGGTRLDAEGEVLSRGERMILANREDLRSILVELPVAERAALATFIARKCWVTTSTVEDPEEAWDMLATEEQTGLKHHDADRAKHSLLAPMPRTDQPEAARIWDVWSGRLGPDNVQDLLNHIRTIGTQRRSTKPIEEDLVRMYQLDKAGLAFITREFVPRGEALWQLIERRVGNPAQRGEVVRWLETLSWLDQTYWRAPALRWLEMRGDDHAETAAFFFALDRLAWLLKIAGQDPVVQERRFQEVCLAIGPTVLTVERMTSLAPDRKLITTALANLRSRTFEMKRYSDLLLRRISLEMRQDPGPLHPDGVTVEHVLPRNVVIGGDWGRNFRTRAQVVEHTNRLGNLAFLTRADNQMAANRSYEDKRRILAASGFLLARDAAQAVEWTPDIIRQRTERMVAALASAWRLGELSEM